MPKCIETVTNSVREPLISIIVPVYQVSPYLRACLDSILEQSYTNYELILVDDGSTDGSEVICDEYAAKDSRIRVIHQQNAGLSAARNAGLDIMKGEYIAFVDSDDVLLTEDYIKILYEALVDNNAEISMCNLAIFYRDEELSDISVKLRSIRTVGGKELFRGGDRNRIRFRYDAAYLKLFKKECFENIRFPVGKYMEYIAISHLVVYPRERVAIIEARLYGYRQRNHSILRTGNNKWKLYIDHIDALCHQRDYFESIGDLTAAGKAQNKIDYIRGAYYIVFAAAGGAENVPSDIMPSESDLTSFSDRRGVYKTLNSSVKESAKIAKKHFTEMESVRARILLHLSSSLIYGYSLPKWETVKNHIAPLLNMAKEENLAYIACEALRRYEMLSEEKRDIYRAYQEDGIAKTLRFRDTLKRVERALGEMGIRSFLDRQPIIDSLYPNIWYRFQESAHLACSLTMGAEKEQIEEVLEVFGFKPAAETSETSATGFEERIYRNEKSDQIVLTCARNKDAADLPCLSERELASLLVREFHQMMHGNERKTLGDLLDLSLLMHHDSSVDLEEVPMNASDDLGETAEILCSLCRKIAEGNMLDGKLTPSEEQLILTALEK